jgi:hypothetical protein
MAVWEAAAAIFLILTKGEPFKLLQAAAAISLKVFFLIGHRGGWFCKNSPREYITME